MTSRYDRTFWNEGIKFLAGLDEVGRGPLAGPVVAAAVILDPSKNIYKVNDSKKLSENKRNLLAPRIKERALAWSVAQASVEEINSLNIINASFLAMKRAINQLKIKPQFLLVDGRDFPTFVYREQNEPLNGNPLVKGDSISLSIACASILAKVYRDNLMAKLAQEYPLYGFENHKGYAAKSHIEAIREYGVCPLHRKKFIRNIQYENSEQLRLV